MSDLAYQIAVRDASSRGDAGSFYRLGCMLVAMGKGEVAAGCFARVVSLEPENHRAWTNLGWQQHLGGRIGLGALTRALRLAPSEGLPFALMSQIDLMLGEAQAAIRKARRAVELEPSSAMHHTGLGLALMRGGEWAEGWREYEWRLAYKMPDLLTRPYRLWRGEWVETLYLEAEQGAGDAIFGLRWVPLAAARVGKVVLYIHQSIYSLVDSLCELPSNVQVLPMPRPLPDAGAWCPLLSLPAALERGEPFFPGESYVNPGICVGWDGHDQTRPRRVAIAWAGDPSHEQTVHRDCPLKDFLPLAEVPEVRLHSVQMGAGQPQFAELGCYGLIEDRSVEITNFADTAKILAGMDLVICVDTAVGHLAGAMGVPCWLLVNRRGQDFRVPDEGDTTPWYPSHRLYRRELGEGWPDVIERVGAELRKLASE